MKKFENGDIFHNRIKAYPHQEFFIFNGDPIYNKRASLLSTYFSVSESRLKVLALKNITNSYVPLSPHYAFSSSLGDKENIPLTLVEVSQMFFGSSIHKGSTKLRFYNTGSLAAEAQDINKNGEIIETFGLGSGSVAGTVLYKEGFVVLTGSWSLNDQHTENYNGSTPEHPSWKYFGANVSNSSYEMEFEGVNYVETITLNCHAEKGELSFSNNPTFIERGQTLVKSSGSSGYVENDLASIKNIKKSKFAGDNADFEKITYVSKIAIFDEDKNVIAVAKLATPIKKTEQRDLTFRLKIDI